MKKYGKIIIIVVGILVVIALLVLIYFKTTFISENEVKDIIAANMNVNRSDLYFEDIDFDFDKGIYEVEVLYINDAVYEYKIDARTDTEGGNVIYTDFKYFTNSINDNNSSNSSTSGSTNNNANDSNNTASITVEEARNIALSNANLSADLVQFLRTETEYDDGILVYEVDFTYNNYEYDYKINANTGEIISYDRDSIYD